MFKLTNKEKEHAAMLDLNDAMYARYKSRMAGYLKSCDVITPKVITNAMFIHKELQILMLNEGINPSEYVVRNDMIKKHIAYVIVKRTVDGLGALRVLNSFKKDFPDQKGLTKSALDKFFFENKIAKGTPDV